MTTSRETERLDHSTLRRLVDDAEKLSLADRLTLLKGLIPSVAREMSTEDFERFVAELRLKGERFYEASQHPGEGRAQRQVKGERDIEGR
jgi:hypothetical protein